MTEEIYKLEQAYRDLETKLVNYMAFDKIIKAQHEARIQQVEAEAETLKSTSEAHIQEVQAKSEAQIQKVRAKSEAQDQLIHSVMEFLKLREEGASVEEKQNKSPYSASTSATQSTPNNISYI